MSRLRGALLVGGGCAIVVAAAVLVADAAGVHVSSALALSVVFPTVSALVVVTLVVGLHWADGVQQSVIAPPERGAQAPHPGVDLRLLDGGRWPVLSPSRRDEVRERLRTVTAQTVARERDVSLSRAERTLDEGTWTDDPVAATLFTPPAGDLIDRISAVVRFRTRTRHAAAAAVRIADDGRVERDR